MNISIAFELACWASIAALIYTYAGYPALIATLGFLFPRPVRRGHFLPAISLIITAYNEERDLAAKLENTLSLDYPRELLEIIVASDCSSDRTDDIAREFAPRGVVRLRQPRRMGKTAAQNAAVAKAHGEIIVFSDATSHYQPDVLQAIVPNFADAAVGCVGGRLLYVDPNDSDIGRGAKSYWGYESFIKRQESRAGSLIGVSGCLYAVRRSAYVPLNDEACSDFIIATKMVEQGLRAIFEPDAICTEETNQRPDNEMKMRVRVIAQTFSDLWRNRAMMNPFRSGLYAWQLLSHKLMRYLVPFYLLTLFVASGALFASPLYRIVFLLQVLGYACAAVSWLLELSGVRSRVLALPHYFVLANVASVIALFQFLRGERYARWQPIR
jgi:cellulose synthase/poly-beta-1,6-N-acetylglucosamine synthase-like glycosyltransferase